MSGFDGFKEGVLSATSFIVHCGESIPILGEIFAVVDEVQRMMEVAKRNDKKAKIVNETCGIIDPVLRRYAGQDVDASILESMKVLRGYVHVFSVHVKDWLGRKSGTLSSVSRFLAGDSASAKLDEDFKNISLCILSFSAAVGVDTNLAVKKMAIKKDYKDFEEQDTSKITKNAEIDAKAIKYESDEPIGEGAFGVVFVALYAGVKVAVKKVNLLRLPMGERKKTIRQFEQELRIMFGLRHPNIVDILGAITTDGNELSLVMEYVVRGDLRGVLDGEYGSVNAATKKGIMMDVAEGMAYLYSRSPPLFHRDLKSPNVLITINWQAKVSDFGMAKADTSAIMSASYSMASAGRRGLGSTKWKAPELFDHPPATFSQWCDVYSYGVVMWELLTGLVPFDRIPNETLGVMVLSKNKRPEPMPEDEGDGLVQLMQKCWEQKPSARPTFNAILKELEPLQEERIGSGSESFEDEEAVRNRLSRAESLQRKQNAFQREKAAFEEEKRLLKQQAEQARLAEQKAQLQEQEAAAKRMAEVEEIERVRKELEEEKKRFLKKDILLQSGQSPILRMVPPSSLDLVTCLAEMGKSKYGMLKLIKNSKL
ncbi:hypothetical protein TrVE_jg1488 [Triparma verrucosa]|uniref:Protein kinase domain-containing protein n=1 Tax=Triparma verrucosa TaxID=1606542 RepID=A0A9W7EZS7_9STRA|nr:hypothetical protein TrVE_jg1488 [Triparma verrucosa]